MNGVYLSNIYNLLIPEATTDQVVNVFNSLPKVYSPYDTPIEDPSSNMDMDFNQTPEYDPNASGPNIPSLSPNMTPASQTPASQTPVEVDGVIEVPDFGY